MTHSTRSIITRTYVAIVGICLTLAGCGGGGGGGGGSDDGNRNSPPPPQVAQFDCTGYFVEAPVNNNWLLLHLPPGQAPVSTVAKTNIQQWTACLYRTGNIVGDYEHIFFFNGVGEQPLDATYAGKSFLVSNFVQGIGVTQFEEWSDWGVTSTLKSVLHIPSIQMLAQGPKLHEIIHSVANFTLEGDEDSGFTGHWGFSSTNGQLGGFDRDVFTFLGPVGNCSQAYAAAHTPIFDPNNLFFGPNGNGGDVLPYSMIELYLMGFAAASELPAETIVAPGAEFLPNSQTQFCAPAGLLVYPTQSWLEGRHGVRNPDSFNTSTVRDVLFVQVVHPDPQPNDGFPPILASCEIWDFTRAEANGRPEDYNFFEATLGRGTLRTPLTTDICSGCEGLDKNFIDPDPSALGELCTSVFGPW